MTAIIGIQAVGIVESAASQMECTSYKSTPSNLCLWLYLQDLKVCVCTIAEVIVKNSKVVG